MQHVKLCFILAATAAVEGKMSKTLKKMLKKLVSEETQEKLLVADAKLGNAIKVWFLGYCWKVIYQWGVINVMANLQDKFNFTCVADTKVQELMRCIRTQMNSLIEGLPDKELAAMSLGLAHRYVRSVPWFLFWLSLIEL